MINFKPRDKIAREREEWGVVTYASEMDAEGNLFLMVYNTSTDTVGSFEVMINEE
jgi:hypothetical protein